MRLPVLLNGHSMTPKRAIRPSVMSMTLKSDGLSTASMTLAQNDGNPEVSVGDWVQIPIPQSNEYTVMYILTKETNAVNGTISLQLQHTFGLLGDIAIFGEVKPGDIASGATSVTVTQAVTWLLNRQSSSDRWWTIGTIDSSVSEPWRFSSTDVLSALNDLLNSIEDASYEFDMSVFPWKLNLKNWPADATGEMRLNRNISTMQISVDRSKMYTRVYPIGKNNINIKSVNNNTAYLQRNTATYGVISQILSETSIDSPSLLKRWASRQLKRNADPAVTVSISGFDLSEATGVPLDRLRIGKKIRVPLPEFGTTVTDRIVELKYPDLVHDDRAVSISMANERKTIHGVLNESNHGGGGGGAPRKSEVETLEWTEKVQTEFNVTATNINGIIVGVGYKLNPDGTIALGSDGYPIRNPDDPNNHSVFNLRDSDNEHTEETIGEIDQRVETAEGTLTTITGSLIWRTKDDITNFVGEWDIETDEQGRKKLVIKSGGGIVIEREHTQFGLFDEGTLTAGVIATKVNGVPSTYIQGENIYIGNEKSTTVINGKCSLNDVTANYISTKIASLSTLGVNHLNAEQIAVNGNLVWHEGNASDVVTAIACTVNQSTGQVRLQWSTADGNPGDVTFSRAASSVVDGVWSGSKYSVTKDGVEVKSTTVSATYGSWSNGSIPIYVFADNGNRASNSVSKPSVTAVGGITLSASDINPVNKNLTITYGGSQTTITTNVNASAVYSAGTSAGQTTGWNLAVGNVSAPEAGTSTSFSVGVPNSTYNTSRNLTFTIAKGATPAASGYASVSLSGTVVGRIAIGDWYTAGHNDGYDDGYDDGAKSITAANIIPPVTGISKASYTAPSTSHTKGQYTAHFTIDRILIDGTHNQNTYGSSSTLTFDADAAYDEGYDEGYDKGYKKCAGEGPTDFRSGAVGTNCGTVARSSTGYITMTVGGYNYYIKVT